MPTLEEMPAAAPVILYGAANPWNNLPPAAPKPRGEFATAFFADPAATDGVRSVAVEVLELWEGVGGAAVVEIDGKGARFAATTARHTLPLDRLASETTAGRKRAAYSAKLALVRPGCCPECWRLGKAIPAASVAECVFAHRHPVITKPVAVAA